MQPRLDWKYSANAFNPNVLYTDFFFLTRNGEDDIQYVQLMPLVISCVFASEAAAMLRA